MNPVDRHSPEGFQFVTNVRPTGELAPFGFVKSGDETVAWYTDRYGEENVVVTQPAFDKDGQPWDGRAVHVRSSVWTAERTNQ